MNNLNSTNTPRMENASRLQYFKNQGKNPDEMRRRRNEINVELRKNKREEVFQKIRNVQQLAAVDSDLDSSAVDTNLKKLWEQTQSDNEMTKFAAIQMIRRCLSQNEHPPIDLIIQYGFVECLVNCLSKDSNPMLQIEAVWALTNIVCGNSEQTKYVVNAGVLPHFTRLLNRPFKLIYHDITEQIIWCIANILGDEDEVRNIPIHQGIADQIVNLVTASFKELSVSFMRNISWAMSNMTKKKETSSLLDEIVKWMPALRILIDHEDVDVKYRAIWSISYLLDAGEHETQIILEHGFFPKLISMLDHAEKKVHVAAIRACGNILTGTDAHTQVCQLKSLGTRDITN